MISCPIIILSVMCASSGATSNSNVTVLSCDNTGSITDGTVTYPIVLNLPLTDVKVPRCVAGRISSPRLSATLAEISPVPVQQGSSSVLVTMKLPFASLVSVTVAGYFLCTLVGIGSHCEYFGSV